VPVSAAVVGATAELPVPPTPSTIVQKVMMGGIAILILPKARAPGRLVLETILAEAQGNGEELEGNGGRRGRRFFCPTTKS
jgi:hypothetical protein